MHMMQRARSQKLCSPSLVSCSVNWTFLTDNVQIERTSPPLAYGHQATGDIACCRGKCTWKNQDKSMHPPISRECHAGCILRAARKPPSSILQFASPPFDLPPPSLPSTFPPAPRVRPRAPCSAALSLTVAASRL
eukprot:1632124-Pleurochrysis_carterae.AAC.5